MEHFVLAFLSFFAFDFSTYFGGAGTETITGLAVTAEGQTFMVGRTSSLGPPFSDELPRNNFGVQTGFVAAWDPTGAPIFTRLIQGGLPTAIAVDPQGNAYIVGWTSGYGFTVTPGTYGSSTVPPSGFGFVMKVSPAGDTIFSAGFGLGLVTLRTLVLDEEGNPIFCGSAAAGSVPLTGSPIFQPPDPLGPGTETSFCAALSSDGSRLLFSTILGGSRTTWPLSAATDRRGRLVVAGLTYAFDFPLKGAPQEADRRRTLFRRGSDGVWIALAGERVGSVRGIQFIDGAAYVSGEPDRWISVDEGQTWRNLPGVRGSNTALIAHPLNPRYLCAATGDALLCSADEGQTWVVPLFFSVRQVVPDPKTEGAFYAANEDGLHYVDLASRPKLPLLLFRGPTTSVVVNAAREKNVLWVVERFGALYRSMDDGSFRKVTDNVGMVALANGNPDVIYAPPRFWLPGGPKLRRSDDGGRTWVDLGNGLERPPSPLVVDPRTPMTVYGLVSGGLYRSNDGGEMWQPVEESGIENRALAAIEVDPQGNLWAGMNEQPNGFLMKIDLKERTLEYSTLLGGTGGGVIDSVRVDSAGRALIAGTTNGRDLPVTDSDLLRPAEAPSVSFLGRFSETGAIESLRHTGNRLYLLEIDAQERIHLAGQAAALTPGVSDPIVRGEPRGGGDALWLVLDPMASAVRQASWFGGSDSDAFSAIAIGADGRVRLAGSTTSRDLPVSDNASQHDPGGLQDGFLVISQPPD